jgi:hypothetical protein
LHSTLALSFPEAFEDVLAALFYPFPPCFSISAKKWIRLLLALSQSAMARLSFSEWAAA